MTKKPDPELTRLQAENARLREACRAALADYTNDHWYDHPTAILLRAALGESEAHDEATQSE